MAHIVGIQDYARYVGLSMLLKGLSVSPLKLQKILYYQQSWNMAFFGREEVLFEDIPQAWVNGPVYPAIFQKYKSVVPGMCDHLTYKDFNSTEESASQDAKQLVEKLGLTKNEIELSDSVMTQYGAKTQNQLILLTHIERPWCESREGLMPYERCTKELSLTTMYEYYKERLDKRETKPEN